MSTVIGVDELINHLRHCVISLDHNGLYVAAAYVEMAIESFSGASDEPSDSILQICNDIDFSYMDYLFLQINFNSI